MTTPNDIRKLFGGKLPDWIKVVNADLPVAEYVQRAFIEVTSKVGVITADKIREKFYTFLIERENWLESFLDHDLKGVTVQGCYSDNKENLWKQFTRDVPTGSIIKAFFSRVRTIEFANMPVTDLHEYGVQYLKTDDKAPEITVTFNDVFFIRGAFTLMTLDDANALGLKQLVKKTVLEAKIT